MSAVPSPGQLVRWLDAYEARVAALSDSVGERECRRLGVAFSSGARHAWYAARHTWLGPAAPLSAFAERANRLALLDAVALRRLLAARALYSWRGMLRRVVLGRQRRALADAVGEHAFAALLELGVHAAATGEPLPSRLEGAVLVSSGRALIAADGGWTLVLAARLVALTLDDDPAGNGEVGIAGDTDRGRAAPAQPKLAAADDTANFLAAVGEIFPELVWLFG